MKTPLLIAVISVATLAAFATGCGGGSVYQHYNGPTVGPTANQALAHEHDLSNFRDSSDPGVADQLRIES